MPAPAPASTNRAESRLRSAPDGQCIAACAPREASGVRESALRAQMRGTARSAAPAERQSPSRPSNRSLAGRDHWCAAPCAPCRLARAPTMSASTQPLASADAASNRARRPRMTCTEAIAIVQAGSVRARLRAAVSSPRPRCARVANGLRNFRRRSCQSNGLPVSAPITEPSPVAPFGAQTMHSYHSARYWRVIY